MNEIGEHTERMRLLKPTWGLYLALLTVLTVICICVAINYGSDLVFVLIARFGSLLLCLLKPVAEMMASRATQKRSKPSFLFKVDIEGEQEMHSSLRAKRLFGHPLGKDHR